MALYVVATPIGNQEDLSPRAKSVLQSSALIICEEFREASTLLKHHGITGKKFEQLNEHSTKDDLEHLAQLCREQMVALVSDCGTPGFCDPGAELVALCHHEKIPVRSVPGASSLMAFLSLCGHRLDQFYFRGFLPANREERARELKQLKTQTEPVILMDTPYRLPRLLEELKNLDAERILTLGLNLSQEHERLVEGNASEIYEALKTEKAEFMLLLHPKIQGRGASFSRKKSK